MPFTFAHPILTIPFVKWKKHFFLPAMILGSMSPDFEYFLRGQLMGIYGHTLLSAVWFNLPLVIISYCILKYIIYPPLTPYLPSPGRTTIANKMNYIFIFCYSALLGTFSHIAWDSFTHVDGIMVKHIPMLREILHIGNFAIPVYKMLQYGGGSIGMLVISCFLFNAYIHKKADDKKYSKSIFLIGVVLMGISFFTFIIWYLINPVPILQYGILVIRSIDSALISLLILSLLLRIKKVLVPSSEEYKSS